MIAARVAGVPMPESFIASCASSSSTSLPAVSIADSSDASEKRRGGLVSFSADVDLERAHVLALLELREQLVGDRGIVVGVGRAALLRGLLAVHAAPARDHEDPAAGAEDVLDDRRLQPRVLEHRLGMEGGQEAADDHVVDPAVVVAHLVHAGARCASG